MQRMTRIAMALVVALAFILTSGAAGQIPPADLARIRNAAPEKARTAPKKPRRLLLFTRAEGYKHSSIPYAAAAFEILGQKTGAFTTQRSDDMAVFAPERLARFDAVAFLNTTQLQFADLRQRKALLDFVRSGKGFIGIHAATDNFYTWPEAADMIGGSFDGHPWGAGGTWAIKIEDPRHPLTAAFQGKKFKVSDEIYRIRQRNLREHARVLIALDMSDSTNLRAKGVRFSDRDIPISWIRRYGRGRVFYSSFGHNHAIYWHAAILQHYLDGIQYALGDLSADATPLPLDFDAAFGARTLEPLFAALMRYEYGKSREALVNLEAYMRAVRNSPKHVRNLEKRYLQLLRSPAVTLAGKQFVCEQLSLMGSKKSVGTLAKMLADSATFEMAKFALERIPHGSAGKALRKMLDKTKGVRQIGLINALAQRRDTKVIKWLRRHIADPDSAVAAASIAAMGRIGNGAAASTLRQAWRSAAGSMKARYAHALLDCAGARFAAGEASAAYEIYAELYAKSQSGPSRTAALRGMVLSARQRSAEVLLGVLQSGDREMAAAAAALAREISPERSIAALLQEFQNLTPATQVKLLSAVAGRRDEEARRMALSAAESPREDVRIAAVQALGVCGDASTVASLAHFAGAKGRPARAAQESLARLRSEGVDAEILRQLPEAPEREQVALIQAAAARRIVQAAPILLDLTKGISEPVRLQAIKSLGEIGRPEHLKEMVKMLVSTGDAAARREYEKSIVAVAGKIAEPDRKSEEILRALPTVHAVLPRASLLRVLGKIGSPAALPVLRDALRENEPELRLAAIRALGDWPSAAPLPDLLSIAQDSTQGKARILALRGFIRLIGLPSDRPAGETVRLYRTAMQLSETPEDKKRVLSGLANVPAQEALALADSFRKDSTLAQEAAAAIVKIAGHLRSTAPDAAKRALLQVLASDRNADFPFVKDAQEILAYIEKFEDYITMWEVSGPYTQEDVDLFKFAFSPEQSEGEAARWALLPANTNPEKPWLVDLGRLFGGDNRVAYLRTRVWVDSTQRARLELGSDDGVKVWLNETLVHANDATRGVTPAEDIVEVDLQKGWNTVLIKIRQGGGGWGACARFRRPDGKRISGLKFNAHFQQQMHNDQAR